MPSTLKDSSLTTDSTGIASGNPPSAASSETSSNRTQPVALEVEVAVNGVRTVEGSDKREPFSETTKTVLVFSNGAVIRLNTPPLPGQLLFLRNERTKKEVVCQVVKSKNYRNVSGYVEVEFTEPSIGFWGMRFPGDRIGPAPVPAAAAKFPAPVAIVPPTPGPSVLPAQTAQTIVAPSVEPPAPAFASTPAVVPAPALPEPTAAKPVELQIVKPEPPAPSSPESSASILEPSAPPAKKWEPETESLEQIKQHTARLQEELSSLLFSSTEETKSEAAQSTTSAATPGENKDLSVASDSLSQLASQVLDMSDSSANPNPPATSKSFSELASKVLEFSKAEPSASAETPAPLQNNSSATPPSFDEDSIKIPSWLEPLARSTVAPASTQELIERQKAKRAAEKQIPAPPPAKPKESVLPLVEQFTVEEFESAASKPEVAELPIPSFGSTLPIDEKRLPVPTFGLSLPIDEKRESVAKVSGQSNKGILIGAVAAVLCALAAGGFWYWKQQARPAQTNAIAQAAPATAASPQTAMPAVAPSLSNPVTSASSANAVAQPLGSTPAASSAPQVRPASENLKTNEPVGVAPASSKVMQPAPAATQPRAAARPNSEPQPEPAKPSLGAVHLAAPKVNRSSASGDNTSSDSAPTLAGAGSIPGADSMGGGLAGTNAHGPAAPSAPVPVGGDVKQARLLSSVPPVYPSLARSQHVGGDVKIDALIDEQGRVSSMTVLSGPTLLRQAAMDALRQWKYQPASLDGNSVPMHLTVTIQFHLQ